MCRCIVANRFGWVCDEAALLCDGCSNERDRLLRRVDEFCLFVLDCLRERLVELREAFADEALASSAAS